MEGADLRCLLLVEDNHDDVIFMEQAFRDAALACPHRVLSDGVTSSNTSKVAPTTAIGSGFRCRATSCWI